jgi:hypothetical protein
MVMGWPWPDSNYNGGISSKEMARAKPNRGQRIHAAKKPRLARRLYRYYELALSLRGEIGCNSVVEFHIDYGRRLIDIVDGVDPAGPVDKLVAGIWKRTQDDSLSVTVPEDTLSRDGHGATLCAADSQPPLRCRSCTGGFETETRTHQKRD